MNSKLNRSALKTNDIVSKVIIAGILLLTILSPAKAQQANQIKPGVFYAITRQSTNDTSYLFGTYHLVKSSYLNQLPNVKKELQNTHGVVTEIVIDSAKLPQAQAMALLKGKTLSSLMSKPFSDSLENELKQTLGVGLAQFDQLKPVNVTLTLSMVYLIKNNKEKLNRYTGQPLDVYFADFGKSNYKTVTPLETVEEQMGLLFNKTSEDQQLKDLKTFLQHKSEMIALGDSMMASWFDNDLDQMNVLYKQTFALSGEPDYLVKDRNIKWMTVLPGLLQQDRQFIGVGALHLVGDYGLVALLRKQGFTVTPLKL